MKKVFVLIGIIAILFSSCAESKWSAPVKNGGSCPENRGMIGMGGDHAPGMRY